MRGRGNYQSTGQEGKKEPTSAYDITNTANLARAGLLETSVIAQYYLSVLHK